MTDSTHLVVCIRNKDYEAPLELRKIYEALEGPTAAEHCQLRVIDESGEDYLYPQEFFVPLDLLKAIEKQVISAS